MKIDITKLNLTISVVALYLLSSLPSSVHAYLGPGMGGGAIIAVLGIIGALIIGLFGIIYFPIKRALSSRAKKNNKEQNVEEGDSDNQANKKTGP